MESMNIYYDEKGDFLEITNGNTNNCFFDNIGNGIFQIIDKTTKEVRGISIHNFKARTKGSDEIKLPLIFKIIKHK